MCVSPSSVTCFSVPFLHQVFGRNFGTLVPPSFFSFILGGAFEAKISSQVLLCTSEYPNCIPVSSSRHLESSFGRAGQAVLVCPFVLFAGRTAPDDTTCPREAVRPRNGRKSDSSSRRQDQIKANEICLTVAVCKTRALERKIVPGRNCCCWTRQVRARQSRLRKWQLNLVGVFSPPPVCSVCSPFLLPDCPRLAKDDDGTRSFAQVSSAHNRNRPRAKRRIV